MQYSETRVPTDDGHELFARRYWPAGDDATRTLVMIHGICEHGERYEHVARRFVEEGWKVIVADLRGHGRSGGVRTHVRHFDQYVSDVERLVSHFGLDPETTALLGHSTGGLIAIRFVQRHPGRIAALVLTSPLLGVKVPVHPCTVALGRVLSYVAPQARFRNRIDPADVMRDQEALERRRQDPLIVRSVTAAWYFAMKAALAAAWSEADRVSVPLLILQAGEDRLVDPVAPELWLEATASADRTFVGLPDHLHEVLNDLDWRTTITGVLQWLDTRVESPAASQQPHCRA